jgi:hypothetical protein
VPFIRILKPAVMALYCQHPIIGMLGKRLAAAL